MHSWSGMQQNSKIKLLENALVYPFIRPSCCCMATLLYLHNQIPAVYKPQHCLVCQICHHRQYPTRCCGRLPHDLHTGWYHQPAWHHFLYNFDLWSQWHHHSIKLTWLSLLTFNHAKRTKDYCQNYDPLQVGSHDINLILISSHS